MKRNGSIDFLKFLFALMIVLFHSKNFAAEGEGIFPGGSIGVEFFFIVSGYLMALSASRAESDRLSSVGEQTVTFIGRKIKGLFPDIYIAWIIAFIVNTIFMSIETNQVIKNLLFSAFDWLFLTQSGLTGYRANAVSWYISAMLIAMALLYPLLIQKRKLFHSLLAPLIVILLFGYMYQTWNGAFGGPSVWLGFAFKGLVRAVAEVSLGCVCYTLSKKLQTLNPTRLCTVLFGIVELLAYLFVIITAFRRGHSDFDYLMVLALAVGITISFSEKSCIYKLCSHSFFSWLGRLSFNLYLGHGFWTHVIGDIFPDLRYWEIMPIYLLICFATALFIMYSSILLRKAWPTLWGRLKPILVKCEKS